MKLRLRTPPGKGKNKIEFADQDGKEYSIKLSLNPEDFGVSFVQRREII